jgi:hypothetical protein
MRVRCGACRTQFEVGGPGRFACPVCGSVNVVRNGAGGDAPAEEAAPPPPSGVGGYQAAPGVVQPGGAPPRQQQPPPKPEEPMPKIDCPECGFNFVVGMVAKVTCPMCSAEVATGIEEDDTE